MHFTTTQAAAVALIAGQALAHPHPHPQLPSAPHSIQKRSSGVSFTPLNTVAQYSSHGKTNSSLAIKRFRKRDTYVDTATAFLKQTVPDAEFRLVGDHYVGSNGIGHVHFQQTVQGLDVDNANFNINIAKDGSIFSFGNSFYSGKLPAESGIASRGNHISPLDALKGVADNFGLDITLTEASVATSLTGDTHVIEGAVGTHQDPKARLMYVQTGGTIKLVWRVETDLFDQWFLSYVDASEASKIHGTVNWGADADYQVYPWETIDPDHGPRVVETDPWDIGASKFTWQGTGGAGNATSNSTQGNNGAAQANQDGDLKFPDSDDYRPVEAGAIFNYDFDPTWADPETYLNASVTQLFYTANMYHDLLYDLGFTEVAGNFEDDNNGAGGEGDDAVILNAQLGGQFNNANFATPPDGSAPRMNMMLWNTTIEATPLRDCVFDASVVIHEFTHGLSNRLTGGPANANCLDGLEDGGMGEGWSDFMALAIYIKSNDTRNVDYPLGAWISNNPVGIRQFLYSTSLETNPLTYASVDTQTEEHSVGTTWATILYEVLWNILDKYGHGSERRPTFDSNGLPTDGRFIAMKIVMDGMALQPCNPNFVQARDAIIDADQALTSGSNACELWTAFAKRGLGEGADRNESGDARIESFVIPDGVC